MFQALDNTGNTKPLQDVPRANEGLHIIADASQIPLCGDTIILGKQDIRTLRPSREILPQISPERIKAILTKSVILTDGYIKLDLRTLAETHDRPNLPNIPFKQTRDRIELAELAENDKVQVSTARDYALSMKSCNDVCKAQSKATGTLPEPSAYEDVLIDLSAAEINALSQARLRDCQTSLTASTLSFEDNELSGVPLDEEQGPSQYSCHTPESVDTASSSTEASTVDRTSSSPGRSSTGFTILANSPAASKFPQADAELRKHLKRRNVPRALNLSQSDSSSGSTLVNCPKWLHLTPMPSECDLIAKSDPFPDSSLAFSPLSPGTS